MPSLKLAGPGQPLQEEQSPTQLRGIARQLLAMADTLERQRAEPYGARDAPSLMDIERAEPHLAALAREEYKRRRQRAQHLPEGLLGEPAWDILIDLFVHQAAYKRVTVTSACYAANVPLTTALRYISEMEAFALVKRRASRRDRRVRYVELTTKGLLLVGRWLHGLDSGTASERSTPTKP